MRPSSTRRAAHRQPDATRGYHRPIDKRDRSLDGRGGWSRNWNRNWFVISQVLCVTNVAIGQPIQGGDDRRVHHKVAASVGKTNKVPTLVDNGLIKLMFGPATVVVVPLSLVVLAGIVWKITPCQRAAAKAHPFDTANGGGEIR